MPVEMGQSQGVAFLVSAAIVYEVIAKDCSSPQTTEINADVRAETTMKWVNIGVVEAVALVAIAAAIDSRNRWTIIWGGALATAVTYLEYLHAKQAGLASSQPGTENWGPG
jgi:uncharacterized membrane protein